jgi:hypothetical protein
MRFLRAFRLAWLLCRSEKHCVWESSATPGTSSGMASSILIEVLKLREGQRVLSRKLDIMDDRLREVKRAEDTIVVLVRDDIASHRPASAG